MKLIVFSDTHGDQTAYKEMRQHENDFDQVYCLGDSGFSKNFLETEHITSVRGNYPFSPKNPYDVSEKIGGSWLFFTHGHLYNVKYGLSKLIRKARKLNVDICGFGHTHRLYLEKKDDIILFNPGALSKTRSHHFPSYARLTITKNQRLIEIINLLDFKPVKIYQEDMDKHD